MNIIQNNSLEDSLYEEIIPLSPEPSIMKR